MDLSGLEPTLSAEAGPEKLTPQQRRLTGSVSADEARFDVVRQRALGPVEQSLLAVTLVSVSQLQQHSHGGGNSEQWWVE